MALERTNEGASAIGVVPNGAGEDPTCSPDLNAIEGVVNYVAWATVNIRSTRRSTYGQQTVNTTVNISLFHIILYDLFNSSTDGAVAACLYRKRNEYLLPVACFLASLKEKQRKWRC